MRALSLPELEAAFESMGEPKYRAKQVYAWLWGKSLKNIDEMSNLSKPLREKLKEDYEIKYLKVDDLQRSQDGTIKNAVRLPDGMVVESVLIPTEKRITACISSQVGCSLDCKFCATARLKRMRNLSPDEIYDQVVVIKEQAESYFGRPLTNIVLMGMGEPLLNYQNVISALDKITSPQGLNMSAKRITLSTVGIAKMIKKMADDQVKFNLALSLHSAIDEVRSKIMPINQSNPIAELTEALQYWYKLTKRKVTYEYVVWKGINDSQKDIQALVQMCKKVPCKVNLIEYNAIGDENFHQAEPEVLEAYQKALAEIGIVAKVRRSRGKDIDAACGQLANKNEAVADFPKKDFVPFSKG